VGILGRHQRCQHLGVVVDESHVLGSYLCGPGHQALLLLLLLLLLWRHAELLPALLPGAGDLLPWTCDLLSRRARLPRLLLLLLLLLWCLAPRLRHRGQPAAVSRAELQRQLEELVRDLRQREGRGA
jgi:hypothetical protein